MKKPIASLGAFFAAFALAWNVQALPPDLSPPPAAFGDSERDGTLLVTDDLREADFGGGLRLPVRWVYRSNNQAANAYGWEGFSLTMLEAKVVKKTLILYEVTMLCGKVIYFNKQPSGVSPQWKSNDKQWGGVEDTENSKFTVTSWDGWILEFRDGRIKKLITEDERTVNWTYDTTDPRLVTEVKELGEDPIVQIEISDDGLKMAGSSSLRGAHRITVNGDGYTFEYFGGTLKNILFPDGRKTQWRFEQNAEEENEKRLTLTQPGGFWRSWVYFDESRLLKTDDVWSYAMTNASPAADGVVYNRPTMERTRIATGEKQKIEYAASNSIEKYTDILGNITVTYRYKTSGKLYDKTFKIERKRAGESAFTVVWRGSYDSETGDLLHSYDAGDNETSFAYERLTGASEFLPPIKVTITDPLGRISILERDEEGNAIKTTNTAGIVRKFEYDSRRRLTKIKNALDVVLARYVYGDKDQLLEAYDALNKKTEYEYITHLGLPLLKKKTTPEGRVSGWSHDSRGRVTKVEGPSGSEWEYTYSSGDIGMADKVTDPLNGEINYLYNDRLNTVSITDPLDRVATAEYDDLDLPVELTDALDQITHLVNNANGNVKELTDPRGKVYKQNWERAGVRKKLEWPDTKKEEVTFDAQGRLLEWKARGGDATVTNAFNAAGEISGQSWVHDSFSGTVSFTRNSYGQLTSAASTAMSLTVAQTITYDTQGRAASLSQIVDSGTRSASVTYDATDRLQTLTYPAGFVVTYEANDDGQLTAVKSGTATLANYAYDAAGRLSTRTLGSGAVTTYSYDAMNRITEISVVASGSTVLWAERYGYNAAGERIYTLSGTSGTTGDTYWLDSAGQLRGVKYGASGANGGYGSATGAVALATWAYDAAGNRETQVVGSGTTSYTVNTVNQYTAVTAVSPLAYNDRGDLITQGDWGYSYDAQGNLIQAQYSGTGTQAKYWRDAFGRRAVKEVDSEREILFHLGENMLEAYDVTGATATSYIYEPGVDRPLAQILDDGTVQYVHQDVLGSVRMLTNASGAKVQTYTYDVWGKPSGFDSGGSAITIEQIASRWLFTGREYDKETALYHYRARAYSPELGRFIQNDPIDFAGGDSNFLRYCLNSPINLIDPFGLAWSICTTAEEAASLDGPIDPPQPNDPKNNPEPAKPPRAITNKGNRSRAGAGGPSGGGGDVGGPIFAFSGAGHPDGFLTPSQRQQNTKAIGGSLLNTANDILAVSAAVGGAGRLLTTTPAGPVLTGVAASGGLIAAPLYLLGRAMTSP